MNVWALVSMDGIMAILALAVVLLYVVVTQTSTTPAGWLKWVELALLGATALLAVISIFMTVNQMKKPGVKVAPPLPPR